MIRDITLEFSYPTPPEQVWQAIADRAALKRWFMENDFEPRLGHRFEFRMPPKPGFDGIIRCEVTELDPPRRLAYTWSGAWGSQSTLVTFSLEPAGSGTRLRFSHTGFRGVKGFLLALMMASGWRKLLGKKVLALLTTPAPVSAR